MDKLADFLKHYSFSAHMFFSGKLCISESFEEGDGCGYLHLIRHGAMTVHSPAHPSLLITEPSLLFYPRPTNHRFVFSDAVSNADLVCASLDLGSDSGNPLAKALPVMSVIPLSNLSSLSTTLELIFFEALHVHCAHQAAIDRLFEYLLIQLLRHVMNNNQSSIGLLAGLADKRLSLALTAMHSNPRRNWSLEVLARTAGMSRARFSVHFREVMGITPGNYLAIWRIGIAQTLLRKGKPVGCVADEVGYGSAAAFSRAFKMITGYTAKAWSKACLDYESPI
jgi:AraC-like DNA-binding protein